LGEKLAEKLRPGTVIVFKAGLGAGKTTLTQGIARGLGVQDTVTSPTYTIIAEYRGRLPFYHIDLYRIDGEEELDRLGLREILYGDGVSAVEWSEKLGDEIPENALRIEITFLSGTERKIEVAGLEP
jgi:tRNA threonylcarbamoyladenosine biosynthesis protein TsaE